MRKHVDKVLATKLRNINAWQLRSKRKQPDADEEADETPRCQVAQESNSQTRRQENRTSSDRAGAHGNQNRNRSRPARARRNNPGTHDRRDGKHTVSAGFLSRTVRKQLGRTVSLITREDRTKAYQLSPQ